MKKFTFKVLPANSNKGFSLLAGINRDVIPSHVTKMAKSIDRMGIVRPIVVAKIAFLSGKEELYIIDGQHLFMALMRAGYDMPYTEIEVKDKTDLVEKIALLNCSSKSWSMRDFIKAWGSIHEDYVKLSNYESIYDIELSQIAEILMDGVTTPRTGGANTISGILKKGEFVIDNEKEHVEILDRVTDALKIVPRLDRVSNKMFISTYVIAMHSTKNYDHKQFLANLKVHRDKFALATQDPEQYKKLFKTLI